jgi:hypothetical protein
MYYFVVLDCEWNIQRTFERSVTIPKVMTELKMAMVSPD